MEDYEKKYKEALGRANAKIETYNHLGNASVVKSICEIFPELRESEDERIKTNIIKLLRFVRDTHHQYSDECNESINWLEKQSEQKHAELVTVVERDSEQWVRVCALGEDFIIAAHNYKDGDKTRFEWEESCNIGTFSEKQAHIMLALLDEINARLEEIGGEPLDSLYWSSSEYSQDYAWFVLFGSGNVDINGKCYSNVARKVVPF